MYSILNAYRVRWPSTPDRESIVRSQQTSYKSVKKRPPTDGRLQKLQLSLVAEVCCQLATTTTVLCIARAVQAARMTAYRQLWCGCRPSIVRQ